MALTMRLKLDVFQRDKWICYYCKYPVVFHPTMRLLQEFIKKSGSGFDGSGYYQNNWRNGDAPLLDYLGAVIDHIIPPKYGGKNTVDNLRTSCNKCNQTKSDRNESKIPLRKHVKGKGGPPMKWDGMSSVFVVLAKQIELTSQEKRWLHAILESKIT
jgi:5-methylcytosine-specific restriction endonuclease McrA